MMNTVYGFDDEPVTLGDGAVNVDGVMVSGSRTFIRDPRLGRLADSLGRLKLRQAIRIHWLMSAPEGMKWCSEHDGDGWVDAALFSPDKRYRDGKHPVCKLCRARQQRRMYALQKQALGQEVRPYRRASQSVY